MSNFFAEITQALTQILKELTIVDQRAVEAPSDLEQWIKGQLSGKEVVFFCGAGISIAPPACAPSFLDLRDSTVLCALDVLAERGRISSDHVAIVEQALSMLKKHCDLFLPPEAVFNEVSDTFGLDTVHDLLSVCLSRGNPNPNHWAISDFLTPDFGWSLVGMITPNFDCYIEDALEKKGVAVSRRITDDVKEIPGGFTLLKPHGSLERPDSICITTDKIARPLKGAAREAFQKLVSGRTILVIGYSGWDHDLLPLLATATRDWGSRILWLLRDEESWNERVGIVKLANPQLCQVINCRKIDVLPVLAGRAVLPTASERPNLRTEFQPYLKQKTDEGLINAVFGLLISWEGPESSGIVEELCAELIAMAREGKMTDDQLALRVLGQVVSSLDNDKASRREAAVLALERAKRLDHPGAVRSFQREAEGDVASDRPNDRRSCWIPGS